MKNDADSLGLDSKAISEVSSVEEKSEAFPCGCDFAICQKHFD